MLVSTPPREILRAERVQHVVDLRVLLRPGNAIPSRWSARRLWHKSAERHRHIVTMQQAQEKKTSKLQLEAKSFRRSSTHFMNARSGKKCRGILGLIGWNNSSAQRGNSARKSHGFAQVSGGTDVADSKSGVRSNSWGMASHSSEAPKKHET